MVVGHRRVGVTAAARLALYRLAHEPLPHQVDLQLELAEFQDEAREPDDQRDEHARDGDRLLQGHGRRGRASPQSLVTPAPSAFATPGFVMSIWTTFSSRAPGRGAVVSPTIASSFAIALTRTGTGAPARSTVIVSVGCSWSSGTSIGAPARITRRRVAGAHAWK